MSYAWYLNPNLTLEDIKRLEVKKLESAKSIMDAVANGVKSMDTAEMKIEYMRTMMPILMQAIML